MSTLCKVRHTCTCRRHTIEHNSKQHYFVGCNNSGQDCTKTAATAETVTVCEPDTTEASSPALLEIADTTRSKSMSGDTAVGAIVVVAVVTPTGVASWSVSYSHNNRCPSPRPKNTSKNQQ